MSGQGSVAEALGIHVPDKLDPNSPVLIVEDQQDMRMICVHHLQKRQFNNVIQAADGLEAIEKLGTLSDMNLYPMVIVCSADLPNMSGIDFVEEIQARTDLNRCAVMMSVANVTKEKILRCVESGVDEIIAKPFTLADVLPKVDSAFRKFNNLKNPELVYEFAKNKLREGDVATAEKVYKLLTKTAEGSARPYVGLARVAAKQDNFAEAYKNLEEAIKQNPHFVHAYNCQGDLYAQDKKWDKSLAAYHKSVELSPLNPLRYISVAKVLMELERYQEIVDVLDIAKKHEVEFPSLFHYYSQAFFHLKNYPKAVRYIGLALNQDPDNLDYLNQQAIALKSEGNLDEAMKSYNKIIKLEPDNIRALYNKAILLKDRGKVPEAIKTLQRLLDKHPDFEKAQKKIDEIKKGAA